MSIYIQNFELDSPIIPVDPYVYEITDNTNGKKLIGSHNGAFGFKYITSTGSINRAVKAEPENFERKILFQHHDLAVIRQIEYELIKSLDAVNDDNYINKRNYIHKDRMNNPKFKACKHCGKKLRTQNIAAHERSCLARKNAEYVKEDTFYGYSYEQISAMFSYDEETGFIYNRKGKHLKAKDGFGYSKISLRRDGKQYFVYGHRLAFFIMNKWIAPDVSIIHVDDDVTNNAYSNLSLSVASTRPKIKPPRKIQDRFDCPHCKKDFAQSAFVRWHGDKCKAKSDV
ncbi:hypothetical protein EOK75_17300 (plasmid) [Pseudorhodobacter turbinis]|uniref:HNH nuclease domain-containing protein n=1 Tax=Pseudorhodobacter turbinis TaxID=2500533 RepID=A0A4P8EJV1_9RHOB|nr:hypothetical protein [Pseudorhodobacter turbinis]QCO57470.1 hypothetical protein EOK75_17300 [Pseudorhodobacter turbinis]